MTCGVQRMYNNKNKNYLSFEIMEQEPKDLQSAQIIIGELRNKCRNQAEQIMKWKKAYAIQIQQHYRYQKEKSDQMNSLTSQLLLLESRLKRKQKQIAGIICHRELTILRQQKLIDALSSRLVDHGLDTLVDPITCTDFDSLNDSDSAVVLEDIDSDCNSSFSVRRKNSGNNCNDITIVRSISDAIETNVNKYGGGRRTNCYLRRPDILETVYSVEEDPEPSSQQQTQQQQQQQQQQHHQTHNNGVDVAERRDKFRNRSERAAAIDQSIEAFTQSDIDLLYRGKGLIPANLSIVSINGMASSENTMKQSQVTNFNRVMSNHRSVTKPKDVKYKRINKAKSKSLEELRGRLKHWVEKGTIPTTNSGSINGSNGSTMSTATSLAGISEKLPQTAQSYA